MYCLEVSFLLSKYLEIFFLFSFCLISLCLENIFFMISILSEFVEFCLFCFLFWFCSTPWRVEKKCVFHCYWVVCSINTDSILSVNVSLSPSISVLIICLRFDLSVVERGVGAFSSCNCGFIQVLLLFYHCCFTFCSSYCLLYINVGSFGGLILCHYIICLSVSGNSLSSELYFIWCFCG